MLLKTDNVNVRKYVNARIDDVTLIEDLSNLIMN